MPRGLFARADNKAPWKSLEKVFPASAISIRMKANLQGNHRLLIKSGFIAATCVFLSDFIALY